MSATATLKAGYGYWDTTHYPYGGKFARAKEDTQVKLIKPAGKYPAHEWEVEFPDGHKGVADTWQGLEVTQ
jgi:hypothetical protein